jgi:DNA repair protein RadC
MPDANPARRKAAERAENRVFRRSDFRGKCKTFSAPVVNKKFSKKRGTGLFSKALLKETIRMLPNLPDTASLDEIRAYLRANLHFNSEQTRHRFSNYVVQRMFSAGYADEALRHFAREFPETQELREICFYRFLRVEPFEVKIIEEFVLTNIGAGQLARSSIRQFISEKFPDYKYSDGCAQAVVDALTAGGIAKADAKTLSFAYRNIPTLSFAFILHSEFPEPGMFDLDKLEQNRLIRAMLWNPDRILHALYELRNDVLISKISEIDGIRQFTTKYSLREVVGQLVSRGKRP